MKIKINTCEENDAMFSTDDEGESVLYAKSDEGNITEKLNAVTSVEAREDEEFSEGYEIWNITARLIANWRRCLKIESKEEKGTVYLVDSIHSRSTNLKKYNLKYFIYIL